MTAPEDDLAECALIGACLLEVQRVEFALYGIAAHATHLPEVASDRRFRNLTPRRFLDGDPSEFKATLGALATALGPRLLLNEHDLAQFVNDRNLLAHNYWRTFRAPGRDPADGIRFLTNFAEQIQEWTRILKGLVVELIEEAARKEGRTAEVMLTEVEIANREAYRLHVAQTLVGIGTVDIGG